MPAPGIIDAPFAPASIRTLSTQDAELWNARVASNPLASSPALPLALSTQNAGFAHSLRCLTAAVYYEAGSEPISGQRAVAQVVLNRVRHPEYPHSVCGVVFQGSERRTGCQFSFTCDGSLQRQPSQLGWQRAQAIAAAALAGSVFAPVGWSTHYHADYVVPYWAQGLQKLTTIGHHIFYRWSGAAGEANSFTSRALASEPDGAWPLPVAETPSTDLFAISERKDVVSGERPIIMTSTTPAAAATEPRVAPDPSHPVDPQASGRGLQEPLARQSTAPMASGERWIIGAHVAP